MKQIRLGLISALSACAVLAGCMTLAGTNPSTWYSSMNGREPSGNRIYICHGFGCTYKTVVAFSEKDRKALARIFSKGKASSPSAEREALSKAIIWQERRVGRIVGSSKDIGGLDMRNSGVRGQMDCIDEATNTTSLLIYAQEQGFLKHHTVSRPVARGFFLDGRYPHATAVITEKEKGVQWAVDSWRLANAMPPDVMLLEKWFRVRSSELEVPRPES
ncbi:MULTISPECIES: hypothetical protein [Pseudovibrio]|uniref:hypothetical protein n=1 Tax=Stappiaceae TaxID=2821832 RepID=UPI0023666AA9|nr:MULTISPECIES: hypothetical protein [Pseudovibrio]MDD7908759.1 hypothetical protein [Pseudovibrio exalbescens]MDX5592832.1 hypothetical protein [Pseudovibrio sp. SPO723]